MTSNILKINQDKIILALIASAVIGVALSFGDLYLFHLVLLIVLAVSFLNIKNNNFRLKLSFFLGNYSKSLFIIFFWYIISLIWAPSLELGLKYIFYIFCGLVLTSSIVYYSKTIFNLDQIFKVLSLLFTLEIIIALLESFTNFRMPVSSYSSISNLFGKDPVDFDIYDNIFLYSVFLPPSGFHWNTNDLAISMTIALPFFLCTKKIVIRFFGILAITGIVVMTASRAVFLGLILIYCLYLVIIKKKIGTLSLIWLVTISIFLGMVQLKESENPRINEIANSIEALSYYLSGEVDIGGSLEWRKKLVENGLKAFFDSYGLGLGAGGSVANQEIIGPVANRFTSMHNFWIEVLVEGGLFVGLIMAFWYFNIIKQLFIISRNSLNQSLKYYSQSLFLSMAGFIPSAIAASSTIYFLPMWIMFGLSISVIFLFKQINHSYD